MGKVRSGRARRERAAGCRTVFEQSPVSLWEEDISGLRSLLRQWRAQSTGKLREHLDRHPALLEKAIRSIRVIDVNDATLRLYEARNKEDLESPIQIAVDPQATVAFKELIAAIAEGRNGYEARTIGRTMSGRKLDLIVRFYIPPERGAYPFLLANVIDVTARRQVEDTLSRERAFLAALMDSMPDFIYFKDTQSRFVMINKAHAQAFHLDDPAEAAGKTDFDFFTEEHARSALQDEQRIMRTGQPLVGVVEKETWPDRPDTWASTTKMPLRDDKGGIVGTFGISRDVTERRHAEERNIRLATLVDSANDAVIGTDLNGTVESWNKGAETTYGYAADQIVGRPISILQPPEAAEQARAMGEKLRRGERVTNAETIQRTNAGKLIHVTMNISPIKDADGNVVGFASISSDITEQKVLRAQIIRAQRLESLGTLAAGIAHQFNNINAALKGYMEVLVRVADLPTAALTYVREMTASLQRSVDITDRLQGLTVARHGGAEPVRLDEVVPSLVRFLEGELEAERVSTRVEIEPGTTVQASPSMLSFILTSLLTNALHALLDCTTRIITIRARIAAGYVTLEVSDTGCGIPPEDLPRIFTPFFTTKGEWAPPCSPQAKVKGVGLSLAVCQSTVAEYGGRIEVESEIGTGTTIRVRLPAGAVASTSIGLPQRSGSALTSGGPSPNGPAS